MIETIRRLHRQNRLVYIIGQLIIMSHDNIKEFDSLLLRIEKRLEHYKQENKR